MKIAIVTSSIGTNRPLDPIPFKGVDYHAFVDDGLTNNKWITHPIIEFSNDPTYTNRRNAKVYKILPFAFLPEYDYFFWVDSTHRLETNPHEVIDKYLNDLVEDQLAFYRDLCYPENNGLYELPVRVQRNTPTTQRMGWMWWEQICMFSSRDQISFPFVCNQLGIKPSILPGRANTIRGNDIMPQIVYSNHNRKA
jgi:hypothetical protein